jgi:sugar phosphate permease
VELADSKRRPPGCDIERTAPAEAYSAGFSDARLSGCIKLWLLKRALVPPEWLRSVKDAVHIASDMKYRWAVLAAGTAAQAAFASLVFGVPILAPALRDEYGLGLGGVGVVLTSISIGATATVLPWGVLADRISERLVLAGGLAACGIATAGAAVAPDLVTLVAALSIAGAAGVAVTSASGRAVMQWFGAEERGFAFGVRQTALPLGGVIAALALPAIEQVGGLNAAFIFLGVLALAGSLVGAAILRDAVRVRGEAVVKGSVLRDSRLWLLSLGAGFYVFAQAVLLSFVVLFLHDERGLSTARAAVAVAVIQGLAVGLRIAVGRWSDRLGTRVVPLRRLGIATAAALVVAAALARGPLEVLVPALVVAGGLSMAWNGLAFTAAAELGGAASSAAAIGLHETALSVFNMLAPVTFAALVAATSWRAGFALLALSPLAGWLVLRPLAEHRPAQQKDREMFGASRRAGGRAGS